MAIELGDYNTVPERIAEFRDKYPNGSLQPADLTQPYRVEVIGDRHYIVVVAAAYRTPDDQRPGIGMAYEQWPGRTPYTKDSELQNAETSAWGRAIVAVLAADTKRGIASQEDVRNRRADDEWDMAAARPPSTTQAAQFDELAKRVAAAESQATLKALWQDILAAFKADGITTVQANELRSALIERKGEVGDSTSDGDGSSAESGPAGAGPGPDGTGAAERGPGLGGEAGSGGSGVQPRVHGGNRIDRGTQARSGDRDTPAAVRG